MRIVDPRQIASAKQNRIKAARRSRRVRRGAVLALLLIGAAILALMYHRPNHAVAPADSQTQQKATELHAPKIGQFSAEQFRNLYNSFSYPNTAQIEQPPYITGDSEADAHIRSLAEARGYRLRSSANGGLVPVSEFFSIQPLALQPWKDLQAAATKAGLNLSVAAAFRSIEDQRELFQQKLNEQEISVDQILSGEADEALDTILQRTAIPGYSRHHTGFTLDLICDEVNLFQFDSSPCYKWLSADNYANAKEYGWVPSYPEGAAEQGPEPEPWEYIWVGRDALYEAK